MSTIYTKEYQQIINTIREARVSQGITQTVLAQALDKPQSFIAKVESGERRLDIVEFMYIAQLLSLDPLNVLKQLKINKKPIKIEK